MGKIKKTVLSKKDRPRTDPKPPSMRRVKRRQINGTERQLAASNTFTQLIPEMVVFRFKKRHRPTETVVHEHYSDDRKDVTSTRRVSQLNCAPDDSVRIAQMELMVKQGLGKIERRKVKVIRHRVDKQDKHFKFHKHDVKF